jgi:hypothetical protein
MKTEESRKSACQLYAQLCFAGKFDVDIDVVNDAPNNIVDRIFESLRNNYLRKCLNYIK